MQKESVHSTMDAKGLVHYISGLVKQTAVFFLSDSIVHELPLKKYSEWSAVRAAVGTVSVNAGLLMRKTVMARTIDHTMK
jgi:hypothetical protein